MANQLSLGRRIKSRLIKWALIRRGTRLSRLKAAHDQIEANAGRPRPVAPPPPRRWARLNNWLDDRAVALAVGSKRSQRSSGEGHVGTQIQGGVIDWDHNASLSWGRWRGDAYEVGEGRRMYTESPEAYRIILEHAGPLLVGRPRVARASVRCAPDDP